jgi:acetyltransferase
MSIYRLSTTFNPRSIAVVGASAQTQSLGGAVLRNLRDGGFPGRIDLINPNHREIGGLPCVATLDDLAAPPELIVVATPAPTIPPIIATAARRGVAAAIVLSAGLGHGPGSLAETVLASARAHGLRLVGPNCLGLIAPAAKLNASFSAAMPPAGGLAVISQSGAIAAAVSEWGIRNAIGFSLIASVGDQIDVDLGDLLDYCALDHATRAILIYVESVQEARKFMSAARAAARTKPVVVIKAGRHAQGARAAATHTGALAGSDAVYDAAFRRAGLLRVYDMAELFAAAETLGHVKTLDGSRLAILTNGGGLGVLAVDRLVDFGHAPAELSEATRKRLDAVLPPVWSRANPVDIIGDADAARYEKALQILLEDDANDAVLVLHIQTAMASAADCAKAVSAVVTAAHARRFDPKPVFTAWVGAAPEIDGIFRDANIPNFATEWEAVRGFSHLVGYRDTARFLTQAPPSPPDDFVADEARARAIVTAALGEGRAWLDPVETSALLAIYDIPAAPLQRADSAQAAAEAAQPFLDQGRPVAVKILSRDITHKSDVDGVRLNLSNAAAVRRAAETVMANAQRARPKARIDGVIVQPMISKPGARELIAGIARDRTFGPVVVFGHGGVAVEIVNDKALALPPLDARLAEDLIDRTRIARSLAAYRNVPAARRDAVVRVLMRLSQIAADIPEISDIDINPLLADENGVLALDARVAIAAAAPGRRYSHMAIRPYPKEWRRTLTARDGKPFAVRPIRPEDEPLFPPFFARVTDADMRLRFFAPVKDFSHAFIARLTQIDYGRAMAFVALEDEALAGVVRLHADPNYDIGEYAILLRSDLKGRGLGWALMQLVIDYARREGLRRIHGQVLRENTVMIGMCRQLGFDIRPDAEDESVYLVSLDLTGDAVSGVASFEP